MFTAHQLLQLALERLRDCPAPRDVRARPGVTLRLLRYYILNGLVDRPRALRGRVGLYDERHLAQLVAIKRWQAEGLDLRRIAARLRQTSDAELARVGAASASPPSSRSQPAAGRVVAVAPGVRLVFDAAQPLQARELARLRRIARRLLRASQRAQRAQLRSRSERA
jgi:DNA-binding transcriptional MerR regulator